MRTQISLDAPDRELRLKQSAAIRKNGRFLGWKLAGQLGQVAWPSRPGSALNLLQGKSSLGWSLLHPEPGPLVSLGGFANAGFSSAPQLPTGFIPTAVAAADFNGDGKMDVAISNGGDNTIYVLLGNGDGTFKVPEILFTQGQSPTWITTVSLRNNGISDLVVTDGDSNSVEVFLGNGDGTFQSGTQFPVLNAPTFVVAGDFNNDGKPDLAVGLSIDPGATQPQFEILLGNGLGGFPNTIVPPGFLNGDPDNPLPTGWVAVGDINKDGFADVVTTLTGCCAQTYLSQAGTSFVHGAQFAPEDFALVVGLGDMDEDGCLDAVELGDLGSVTIAKGTCDGNFTQTLPIAEAGDLDPAIVIADVNGDGHLDVVGSAAFFGFATEAGYLVSVMIGDGKGNLTMGRTYRAGSNAFSLVVADFNGDKKPDVITADSLENHASLLLNDGTGGYGARQGEAIGYTNGVANSPQGNLQVADFNGDGKPDLFLVEQGEFAGLPGQLTVMLNDGTGKFLPPVRTAINVGPTLVFSDLAAGAFRNPAKPDLIYVTTFSQAPDFNIVAFFPGNGDGTFGAPTILATLGLGVNPLGVVAGDFNGDGKLDFVVAEGDGAGEPAKQFDVFLGHGDGTFTHLPTQSFPIVGAGGLQQLIAVDLNHDGKLDLLIGNNANDGFTLNDDLLEAIGNGDGTFQNPTVLIQDFGAVAVADVNHDGFIDLIQERDPAINHTFLFTAPAVTIYLGRADGSFQKLVTYDLPGFFIPSFEPALVGDFNGDGIPDIGVLYYPQQLSQLREARIRILQGVGDGTFTVTNHFYQLQVSGTPIVGADFNGDGTTDLMELDDFASSFNIIPAAAGPSLDISFNSSPIIGSQGSASVSLDQPASSDTTVTLSSSDPAVTLPASVKIASGQQSQSFSFSLGAGFDQTHALALSATLGAETAVAYSAKPNPNATTGVAASLLLPSLPVTKVTITPGQSVAPTLNLTSESGYTGTFGSFACGGLPAGASCSFDANTTFVPEGGFGQVGSALTTSSSTPFGIFPVQFTTTDGFFQGSTTLQLGIGDFSLQMNPTLIVLGPTGGFDSQVTSSSTNGLSEFIAVTCQGLPATVSCAGDNIPAAGGSGGVLIQDNQQAAADYPFQLVGTIGVLSHSINAILRVGNFNASLDKTTATLGAGQSATFNVTLTSINHYATTISVFCQPASHVTCQASPLPATLGDDGTTNVQLTVSRTASGSVSYLERHVGPVIYLYLFGLAATLLLACRRRLSYSVATSFLLLLIVSCGGGGGSASNPGPQPSPTPQSQTVTVSVVAQAALTQTDSGNQKILGPIVITLD